MKNTNASQRFGTLEWLRTQSSALVAGRAEQFPELELDGTERFEVVLQRIKERCMVRLLCDLVESTEEAGTVSS